MRLPVRIIRIVLIISLISGLMAIPAYVISDHHRDTVIEELQTRAANIAAMVSVLISTEMEGYRALVSVDDYASQPYDNVPYQNLNALLHKIQHETQADFIFTEKYVNEEAIAYILDGTDPQDSEFSPIGTLDTLGDVERRAFTERIPLVTPLIEDPYWGSYITAFHPIVDTRDGSFLGLVGVDFSAETVTEMSRTMNWIIALSFFALMVIMESGVLLTAWFIYHTSYIDYLTKLYSRRYLLRRLRTLIHTHNPVCLIMIDVDHFKLFNDTLGHSFGDTLLLHVAQVMTEHSRPIDICCRYGGDEFIMLLPECSLKDAHHTGRRILDGVSRTTLGREAGLSVTISIGLAVFQKGMDEQQFIASADAALYQAKQQGRNQIVVYEAAPVSN